MNINTNQIRNALSVGVMQEKQNQTRVRSQGLQGFCRIDQQH
jgi:hypothetical protein